MIGHRLGRMDLLSRSVLIATSTQPSLSRTRPFFLALSTGHSTLPRCTVPKLPACIRTAVRG